MQDTLQGTSCNLPALLKMDSYCRELQSPEGGACVRQLKYFRVAVPQAVTGSDIIHSLSNQLHVDDVEAHHMANILCQYGYIFPVFDKELVVNNDSSIYRFQVPYFWPSNNGFPDNIEYAIYLSKRLLRNEEKHGLEEYEMEAYKKIRELLGHMWDFITVQSEMQLKIFKEKKKVDKVVFDSQERAFWRMHRGPGGPSSLLDCNFGNIERKIKKRGLRDYELQIEHLKFRLKTKPWLKSPKATEQMVSWCEHFGSYDPFLVGCLPSNPWISEDATLWSLNTDSVEVPTERRVQRWGFSVQELLRDGIGRQVLETFLESEFSSENIRFWIAVQDLKHAPNSQVPQKMQSIYEEFLAHGAHCQVNVDSRTLESATSAMKDGSVPLRYAFSQAEEHIFILMAKDSYPRFVRSEIYKGVLSAAQQQGSKRMGWRNFINVASKKLSTVTTGTKHSQQSTLRTPRDDNSSKNLPPIDPGLIKKLSRVNDSGE